MSHFLFPVISIDFNNFPPRNDYFLVLEGFESSAVNCLTERIVDILSLLILMF